MRLISSKKIWYEEECVEYENEEEYKSDLDKRKHEYWMQMKIPDFENGKMKLLQKKTNKGFCQFYRKYHRMQIGYRWDDQFSKYMYSVWKRDASILQMLLEDL